MSCESRKCTEPDSLVTAAKLAAFDRAGCSKALIPRAGAIAATNESGDVGLHDGSKESPIITPNLVTKDTPASTVIALGQDGQWYGLKPTKQELAKGKCQLVHEAGSTFWESISRNRTVFNRADVENGSNCDFKLAGWEECAGQQKSKLIRLSDDALGKFFGCDGDGVDELESIIGCSDGGLDHLAFPENVNGVPIPGIFARTQGGKVVFIAAPVDSSGLVSPGYSLTTPVAPVAGQPNAPQWTGGVGYNDLSADVLIGMLFTGVGLGDPATGSAYSGSGVTSGDYTVATAGVPSNAKTVWVLTRAEATVTGDNADVTSVCTINGRVMARVAMSNQSDDNTDRDALLSPVTVNAGKINISLAVTNTQAGSAGVMAAAWIRGWS